MTTSPRIDAALFALGFLIAGLVLLALAWSPEAPYRDLARDNGATRFVFIVRSAAGGSQTTDLETATAFHGRWSRYVTGGTTDPPRFDPPLFGDDEYAHMADVRRVFDGAKLLVPAGLFLMGFRLQRARLRGLAPMLRVARDGTLIALVVVVLIGIVAALAFDQLFLLFHYVFFPQGNFLFDPRTTNLTRLYPDWYWEGITLRIGLSFVALAAAVFAASAAGLRRAQASRLASE